jgi:hypothetical protein
MFDANEANGIDFRFNICDTARLVGSYGARWLSAEPSRPLPRLVDSATHDEKHSSMSEFPESVARFADDAPDAIAYTTASVSRAFPASDGSDEGRQGRQKCASTKSRSQR